MKLIRRALAPLLSAALLCASTFTPLYAPARAQSGRTQATQSEPHQRPRRAQSDATPPAQAPPPVPAGAASPQDEEVERVETNLVNLLFNAVDKERRFVTTITRADVRVFEDDVEQTPVVFQRETDLPLSLAILIDVSYSQKNTLPDEKAAAHIFVDSVIRPGRDAAAVVSFTGGATVEQDLTDERASLHRAIDRVSVAIPRMLEEEVLIAAGGSNGPVVQQPAPAPATDPDDYEPGSTALWDAVWATSADLLAQTPPRTRRAIILLSDGKEDSRSPLKRQDAVEAAIKANTTVYAIGIGDYELDEGALKKLCTGTGGRAFFPEDEQQLNAAFKQIEQELRTQYLVAYSPTNRARDGSYRRIRIELVNPELKKQKIKLTYREGYYANPPAAPAPPAPRRDRRLARPPRPPRKR